MEVTPTIIGKPETPVEPATATSTTSPATSVTQTPVAESPKTIFDEGVPDEPNNTTDKADGQDIAPSADGKWYVSEGVEGIGEKPDWFIDSKYKTVAEQAKAVKELRTKYNEMKEQQDKAPKPVVAPENYDFASFSEHIDPESPSLKHFAEKFKKHGISQEAASELVKDFVDMQVEMATISPQKIIEEVGAEGKEMFKRVSQWAKNNLSEKEQIMISQIVTTGEGLAFVDRIRSTTKLSRLPNTQDYRAAHHHETLNQVKAEKRANFQRYSTDPHYAKEISERFKAAAAYEGISNEAKGRKR